MDSIAYESINNIDSAFIGRVAFALNIEMVDYH